MEMDVFKVAGKEFTRFKLSNKEYKSGLNKMFKGMKPTKQNSRFIYFEVEGDLINTRRKERDK